MQPVGHLNLFWVVVCLCVCARTVVVAKVTSTNKSIGTKLHLTVTDLLYLPEYEYGEINSSDLLYPPEQNENEYGDETPDDSIDIYDDVYQPEEPHKDEEKDPFNLINDVHEPDGNDTGAHTDYLHNLKKTPFDTYDDYGEDNNYPPGVKESLIGDKGYINVETKDGSDDHSRTTSLPGGGNKNNTHGHSFQLLCLFCLLFVV